MNTDLETSEGSNTRGLRDLITCSFITGRDFYSYELLKNERGMMIREILKSNSRRYPNRNAIIYKDIRYTFEEFNSRVNRLANALTTMGLSKGDWVAMVADDCAEHVELFWAGAKVGIATSALNPAFSERDFSHLIGNGKAAAVVCSHKYCNLVESLRPTLESVKGYITLGPSRKGFVGYEDLISTSSSVEPDVEIDENNLLYFANTSGTTGLSKQVMHTHKSLLATALMDLDVMDYDMSAGGASLIGGPHFWAYLLPRITIPCFYMGCTLVIPPNLTPQGFLQAIEKEKVTNLTTGTAFLQQIMDYHDLDKYDYSSLRRIFIFGYYPPEVWRRAVELFGNIFVVGYGLSEIGLITFLPPEDFIFDGPPEKVKRLKSCGREGLCVDARVVDDQGEDVQPGQVGEIIAKGPDIMKGYWNAPDATAQTVRGGYVYTGDLATVDEEGYIYLAGRKKDSITTQGKMVLPSEIEEIILQHPQVVDAAVIGLPDEKLGEAIKAVVVKREGELTGEEIIMLCRQNLPGFAVPRSVEFVETLPKTASGRVQRYKIREKYL
ncbi:MAG: class I adenylate-forming enzyme family protein [Pseudomonadota bacterium]